MASVSTASITKYLYIGMYVYTYTHTYIHTSHQFGLVVSVSASHAVGCEFIPMLGHAKDHHKNGINCLPA